MMKQKNIFLLGFLLNSFIVNTKLLLTIVLSFFCIFSFAQNPSDGCTGIPTLTVNGTCTNTNYTVPGSYSNGGLVNASCAGSQDKDDGWYQFVATSTSTTVDATGDRRYVLSVWTACAGGTELGCDFVNGAPASVIAVTTIGVTYFVQIHRRSGNNGAAIIGTICAYSPVTPTCSDGIQNQGETGIDCGGPCPACGTCSDGIQNGTETGIDCGGSCPACATGYNMANSNETTCNGTFYDSGGSGTDYSSGELLTMTFTPDAPCSYLQFVFTSFTLETCCDDLTIYDGPNTASPLIGTFTTNPGTITATNQTGELTFVFDSDGSIEASGWVANISCIAAPTCSGTPNAGSASANPTSIDCSTTSSVISATGLTSECDATYQWQSAAAPGGPWTNIVGEINDTYTASPSSNTYYRIVTTCANGGATNSSSPVLLSSTFSLPPNDDCASAIALTVNPNYSCGTVTSGTVACASQSADAEGCTGNSDDDVWYSFVATSITHRISLINIAGSTSDMYHSIYSGACGSLTELICNDGNITNMVGLTIGVTYYVRVYTWTSTGGQTSTFDVCIGSPPPPPSNDEPCNATIASVNPDLLCGSVTAGYTTSATNSGIAACVGSGADDDVWFSFTATNTVHNFDILNITGTSTDMVFEIFSGPCGTMSSIACSDPQSNQFNLFTPGTIYHLRVYTYSSGEEASFNLCIGTPPPPPSNDDPCNATIASVNPDLLCGSVTAGYTTSATNSGIVCCLPSGGEDDDVWFSFTATNTVHNFDLLNITGTSTDMVFEIFSGPCGTMGSIACSDPESNQFNGFTIGTMYHLRVYTYRTGEEASFNLCIGTPPPPPSNDEPCGALSLNVNVGSCSYQSGVLGVSSTTSTGMPAPGCGALGQDIWYTFIVPPSGRIIIDMAVSGGPTDMDMAWYTSSTNDCNNLDGLVDCDDSDSQNGAMAMICWAGASCVVPGDCQQNTTLTPGETVWVRLWEFGGGTFGPFDICAYDPGAPGAVSDCGNPTNITSLPFSNSGATTCCRGNSYNSTTGCFSSYQDGEDYMYTYTPSANESVDITLTGTLGYTGIFVTDDCPSAGGVNCVASATDWNGNPTICGISLVAGNTYYIMIDTDPNPNCTPFNINMTSSSTPTCGLNYTISNIPFAPDLNTGTNIALPIDDRFYSSYIPLGFDFCFDGYEFSQGLISSNGYLIFDPIGCSSNLPTANAAPGNYSSYSINSSIPNTSNAPRNAVMFPWQDIDPSLGGTIKYQTLGTAPNRRFVITFDGIPYYSCNSLLFTGQLKLYETTNMIEMHIGNKGNCSGWNSGAGILGLHNYNGTVAVVDVNYPTSSAYSNIGRRFSYNCTGPCIQVLPVTLLSFDGESEGDKNILNWRTATEINNNYFLLEHSYDGLNFEPIGTIDGGGNSTTLLEYSFTHENPLELEYYRLKQVDFDGKFEYSKIIAVNSEKDVNINIFPNPAKNKLFFNLSKSENDYYTISYSNILGAVFKEKIKISKGQNIYEVAQFKNLTSGVYFIQIINKTGTIIKAGKVVKN